MPFVNIRIYEGWGKERKDEIARRVTGAITEVTGLPKEAVWVVIEEVDPHDWPCQVKFMPRMTPASAASRSASGKTTMGDGIASLLLYRSELQDLSLSTLVVAPGFISR